jgi:hypothetical protein
MPFGMVPGGKPLFGEPLNGSFAIGVTCVPLWTERVNPDRGPSWVSSVAVFSPCGLRASVGGY